MSTQLRIGLCMAFGDAFWVEVREAFDRRSKQIPLQIVSITTANFPLDPSPDEQHSILEEIISQELDVIFGWNFPEQMAHPLLDMGLPIVHLSETNIDHPLSVSPLGLQAIARDLAHYLARKLDYSGHVLAIGGLCQSGLPDDGRTRVVGIQEAFRDYPRLRLTHIPTKWDHDTAYPQIVAGLLQAERPIDAVYGLSDSLALLGREIALQLGCCRADVPLVGINGEPLALAAIIQGNMIATVQTPATELVSQAFEIALNIALGKAYPRHFEYKPRFITSENVAQAAVEKLVSIADMPDHIAGFNRQEQLEHLANLETSLKISRQIGSILDYQKLPAELAALISTNYGYDCVQLFYWSEIEQILTLVNANSPDRKVQIPLLQSGVLGEALTRDELLFIPDTQRSFRFAPDPEWLNTRTRVIFPIRLGGKILGLLDLHANHVMDCTPQHLLGLQSLAEQLGVAIQNARLYQEALQARATAEKADEMRTRFMTNISHDLRNPLHIVLGYAENMLGSAPHHSELRHIQHNAKHLLRLVNDLLDLSRAEMGELQIAPEPIEPHTFLAEVFHSIADQHESEHRVSWRLQLPAQLPTVRADPDRLRQILLNLLSNAKKFTTRGEITLGAEIASVCLHLWVRDTGTGISAHQQERIFEPFGARADHIKRMENVGLGLSITRTLVALHGGSLVVDSQLGTGSTFHVYLPLPNLKGLTPIRYPMNETQPFLLLISDKQAISPEIVQFSEGQAVGIRRLRTIDDIAPTIHDGLPTAIVWDCDATSNTGWQILQRLHEHPALNEVPFLLYGHKNPDEPIASVTNILLKPIKPKTLLGLINGVFSNNSTGPILIVDDDADARAYLHDIVAKQLPAFPVQTACSGLEALTMMEREAPRVVILDLVMPEVDGFEVVRQMRSNPHTLRVPILILSGKMLTFDDIQRLESYQKVTLQTKNMLTHDELGLSLQRVLFNNQSLPAQTSTIAKQAVAYVHQNYANSISRAEIARAIGVSENYLTQIFHQELGIALWEYINRYRVTQARELLSHTDHSISYIASQVGFDDPAYFSRVFRHYVGQSPRTYRVS